MPFLPLYARPSFLRMSKLEKLELLGQMYDLINSKSATEVNLKLVEGGSDYCIAGWCARDRYVARKLRMSMRTRGSGWILVTTDPRIPKKHREIGFAVFREPLINLFLFGRHSSSLEEEDHRTAALIRLLFIGSLVNTEQDHRGLRDDNRPFQSRQIVRESYYEFHAQASKSKWIRKHLGLPVTSAHTGP